MTVSATWLGLVRAARSLWRRPGHGLAAVLTLALGMGGALALFSAFYSVAWRMPPYPGASRLYRIALGMEMGPSPQVSAIQAQELAASTAEVEALAIYSGGGKGSLLETAEERLPVEDAWVDPQVLPLLGITPRLGTGFTEADHASRTGVLLSHRFWMSHFGGDPGVVGQNLAFADRVEPIRGVLAPGSELPFAVRAEVVRPLVPPRPDQRGDYQFTGLVRLRPGVDPRAVEAAFTRDVERQRRAFPLNNAWVKRPRLEPLRTAMAGLANRGFYLACGAAGLLLFLATLNVAALFLDEAARRSGEWAVRLSLGARRRDILARSLPEGLLVAAASALLGLLVAARLGSLLRLWLPGGERLHGLEKAWAHPVVAAFAVGLVLVAGLLLGLMPLVQLRGSRLEHRLRAEGNPSRASHRVRDGLVVAQLALATLLMTGVGLLGFGIYRLVHRPLGFEAKGLMTVELEARVFGERHPEANIRPLLTALEGQPWLQGVAQCGRMPGNWEEGGLDLGVGRACYTSKGSTFNVARDAASLPDSETLLGVETVSEGYFPLLGLTLRQGRGFSAQDLASGRRVCVLDEAAARRHFPDGALGGRLYVGLWCDHDLPGGLGEKEPLEVIGVVRDHANRGAERPGVPSVYLPASLVPPLRLVLRTDVPETALRPLLDQALRAHLPSLRVARITSVQADRWERALPRRQMLALLLPFGLLALILAALGLGALSGSQVVQRTRELGIRAAMGATPGRQVRDVLMGAFRRACLGGVLGLALSLALVRTLEGFLFGASGWDPAALLGVILVLLATTLLASLLPALWASRVAPSVALRAE